MKMEFTDLLASTAPEPLKETARALRLEIGQLLKTHGAKKYLVLEPYARNTELCRHILRRMEELPDLPSVSQREFQPLLMLLSLSKEVEIQNELLHRFVEPWRKAYRTPEMLFVEWRKQLSRQYTPLTELDFQFAEKRLKPLYAAVFRMKANRYSYRTHSVEELAGMFCMSVSSFREKFRKIYRRSANSWLQEQRTGQVRRDLKYHYDRPLLEIAEKNGFSSASRFWEFCTERLKQSPSELHKELYDELCEERRKFYLGE